MRVRGSVAAALAGVVTAAVLAGCDDTGGRTDRAGAASGAPVVSAADPAREGTSGLLPASAAPSTRPSTTTRPPAPNPAGNPAGGVAVPAEAQAADTSHPDQVIGTGKPASCTSDAVIRGVAAGGVITFNCGPAPVTIKLTATAKVRNSPGRPVVLDGGGKVTLSGGGKHRILYLNTCDPAQGTVTPPCQDRDAPRLTLQNLTLADGDATGERTDGGGGGAVFVRGGRFSAVNTRFLRNRCDRSGAQVGGGAVRVLNQYHGLPVYLVGSTFQGNSCANGGAVSGVGVSWAVLNSVFSGNAAVGRGADQPRPGTPGGGNGGAIACTGDDYMLRIAGTVVENNRAAENGAAVWFVSGNRAGTMSVENSTLRGNRSGRPDTRGYPGISFQGGRAPVVTGSRIS